MPTAYVLVFDGFADWEPASAAELPESERLPHDFAHHLEYDTTRIRDELGYREIVPRELSLARTLEIERGARAQRGGGISE